MSKPKLHVAIGIMLHQNKVLVGWRKATQHQGNKYEFPGGKVEEGETPLDACRREIHEEVGIKLNEWHAVDVICHEYEDIIVNLHFFQTVISSTLADKIQQPWSWYTRDQLVHLNFPKANQSIVNRLYWPKTIKISEKLAVSSAFDELFYWDAGINDEQLKKCSDITVEQYAKLIVNIEFYKKLNINQQQAILSIHLKQDQLLLMSAADLMIGKRYIATCHHADSILHAQKIGCEAILFSPIQARENTMSEHTLSLNIINKIDQDIQIPIFVYVEKQEFTCSLAWKNYAYGIAQHV